MLRVLSCPVCETWVHSIPHTCADGTVPGLLLFEAASRLLKTSNRIDRTMAKVEHKVRTISTGEGLEIPPLVKKSKYPWDFLAANKPAEKNFFVECENQAESDKLKSSVYSSGRQYYLKRKINRIPVVRSMKNKAGIWGVAAWSVEETQG